MSWARDLRRDLPASIVVFFVAVPLCLGIALASGTPLFSGLISGIVGGIVVGLLSGSTVGVSGPAAGLAVIVYGAIQTLGSFETFLVAVVLAGALQIAMGLARAGVVAYFFPSSVIKGMLSGIGLLIILKQIPHALGWDSDPEGDLTFVQPDGENTFSALLRAAENVDPSALVVSTVALGILLLWERVLGPRSRIFQVVQGPLVAVAFGILYQLLTLRFAPAWALSTDHLVSVPVAGSLSEFAGLFTGPDWSQLGNSAVHLTAVTLAVVASLETLLCVEATDKMDPKKGVTPTNRELCAQGAGNIVSGLAGGLPLTQVIVRSSANIQSGAASKVSAILHGVLLLVFVLALPQLLNLIPLAVLASILLVVGYKLATPALYASLYRQGPSQFVPFAVTVMAILLTDLLVGVALGLGIAVLWILHRSYLNSHFVDVVERKGPGELHRVHLRLAEQVSFLNRGAILKELGRVPERTHVVIDLRGTVAIDHDVLEIIEDFAESADRRQIVVEILAPQARPPRIADAA